MTRTTAFTIGAALALAAALLSTGAIVLGQDPRERNLEVLPDMVYAPDYDAFAENPNFPDGSTLRPPVAGTIARGFMPLRYGASAEEAARAGAELLNPVAESDAAAIERGRARFMTFCSPCHGASGRGDGAVTRRGVPPPPTLMSEKVRAMKDGQLFHIVTFGQGNMPPYAAQVEREDRWKIVRYIRTLKETP